MANTFKNSVEDGIGVTPTTVYTTPVSTTSTVLGLSLANVDTGDVTGSVTLVDSSTSTTVYLIKDAPITSGSSLVVVGKEQKVILEAGDYIQVVSDTASAIDVVVSVMEMS